MHKQGSGMLLWFKRRILKNIKVIVIQGMDIVSQVVKKSIIQKKPGFPLVFCPIKPAEFSQFRPMFYGSKNNVTKVQYAVHLMIND